jgi:hypothetical protein
VCGVAPATHVACTCRRIDGVWFASWTAVRAALEPNTALLVSSNSNLAPLISDLRAPERATKQALSNFRLVDPPPPKFQCPKTTCERNPLPCTDMTDDYRSPEDSVLKRNLSTLDERKANARGLRHNSRRLYTSEGARLHVPAPFQLTGAVCEVLRDAEVRLRSTRAAITSDRKG